MSGTLAQWNTYLTKRYGTFGAQTPRYLPVRTAESFANMVGVATHIGGNYARYNDWTTVRARFAASKIRNFRDWWHSATFLTRSQELFADGKKLVMYVDPRGSLIPNRTISHDPAKAGEGYWYNTNGTLRKLVPYIRDSLGAANIRAVEMPNEPNFFPPTKWRPLDAANIQTTDPLAANYIVDYIKELNENVWADLQADPATRPLPLYGTSWAGDSEPFFAATGDQSAFLTHSNDHIYFIGRRPEIDVYSGDLIGVPKITFLRHLVKQHHVQGGDKLPFACTEGGYFNGPINDAITESGAAIYMPRALMMAHRLGFDLFTFYELIDRSTGSTSSESNYGLLRDATTGHAPKPALAAIDNLIAILEEPGAPSFVPQSLPITFSRYRGIETHLIQRSTGEHFLAIWQNASVWDIGLWNSQTTKDAAACTLVPGGLSTTLTFSGVKNVTPYEPNVSTAPGTTATGVSTYTLNVTANIKLLRIS